MVVVQTWYKGTDHKGRKSQSLDVLEAVVYTAMGDGKWAQNYGIEKTVR